MAVQATFQQMGIRSEKYLSTHLLLENAHESNLVPDIANVDYLANHLGRTSLRPLEGLPTFVDDVYVFGYLRRGDCVVARGQLSCTTGEYGSAKDIVSRISTAIRTSMRTSPSVARHGHIPANIVRTLATQPNSKVGSVRTTISRIEADTNKRALAKWLETYPDTKPAGIFVAKLDVSEIPIDDLQNALPGFERLLLAHGYGLYCIDYTRDFSGTLDRKTLVEHLCTSHGFREQGDLASAMCSEAPTILANTDSVGKHVCTWVQTGASGNTTRTKIYNKVVSNFEAGEVCTSIGGHLADYVDCPNEHLRRTFLHPDVQARGCTRVEVSLYACRGGDLSTNTADVVVGEALRLVSPQDSEDLFVVQPPTKQWENLATNLDRCLVLADRPQGSIFVAWYAHTTTRRISGVRVRPNKANADDDTTWENAVLWAAADFGFRSCPIFRVDILSVDGEENEEVVELAPLRCYTKFEDSNTILAASKRPTQLHPLGPAPETLLPATTTVSWVWRTQKCSGIGRNSSKYPLLELPAIAQSRTVSTLSTRGREERLQQIRDATIAEDWRRVAWARLEAERQCREAQQEWRTAELEKLSQMATAYKYHLELSQQAKTEVADVLGIGQTGKISAIAGPRNWLVLGYRRTLRENRPSVRVVLLDAADKGAPPVVVWATRGLEKVLENCGDAFERIEESRYSRTTHWLVPVGREKLLVGLEIEVAQARTFRTKDDRQISWNPIVVAKFPDPQRRAILQALAEKERKYEELGIEQQEAEGSLCLQKAEVPKIADTSKVSDLQPGEYVCRRYAAATFRGAARSILFLVPLGPDGEQTTDVETPVFGHFLKREVSALGGIECLGNVAAPMACNIGAERTTPQKKKDRLVALAIPQASTT